MHKSLLLALIPLVSACSSLQNPVSTITNSITPHHIEIQQGNVVTQEMLNRLKPGMTPSQVRFVMGTPLVVDPFRMDRWDYVYLLRKGGQNLEKRRITIVFEEGRLKGVEGDIANVPAAPTAPQEVTRVEVTK